MIEHVDLSAALEKQGIKVTVVKYGANKAEGHPAQPLSEDAMAHTQAIVDSFGRQFESDVAKGRNVSIEKVRSDYGQGAVFGSLEAKARGLVDEIASLDDVLARLVRQRPAAAVALAGPSEFERAEMEAAQARARVL